MFPTRVLALGAWGGPAGARVQGPGLLVPSGSSELNFDHRHWFTPLLSGPCPLSPSLVWGLRADAWPWCSVGSAPGPGMSKC